MRLNRLACVDDLVTPAGVWNKDIIYQNFLREEADKICNLNVGGIDKVDKLAWMHSKDGCYTVKSGYWAAKALEEVIHKKNIRVSRAVLKIQIGSVSFGLL